MGKTILFFVIILLSLGIVISQEVTFKINKDGEFIPDSQLINGMSLDSVQNLQNIFYYAKTNFPASGTSGEEKGKVVYDKEKSIITVYTSTGDVFAKIPLGYKVEKNLNDFSVTGHSQEISYKEITQLPNGDFIDDTRFETPKLELNKITFDIFSNSRISLSKNQKGEKVVSVNGEGYIQGSYYLVKLNKGSTITISGDEGDRIFDLKGTGDLIISDTELKNVKNALVKIDKDKKIFFADFYSNKDNEIYSFQTKKGLVDISTKLGAHIIFDPLNDKISGDKTDLLTYNDPDKNFFIKSGGGYEINLNDDGSVKNIGLEKGGFYIDKDKRYYTSRTGDFNIFFGDDIKNEINTILFSDNGIKLKGQVEVISSVNYKGLSTDAYSELSTRDGSDFYDIKSGEAKIDNLRHEIWVNDGEAKLKTLDEAVLTPSSFGFSHYTKGSTVIDGFVDEGTNQYKIIAKKENGEEITVVTKILPYRFQYSNSDFQMIKEKSYTDSIVQNIKENLVKISSQIEELKGTIGEEPSSEMDKLVLQKIVSENLIEESSNKETIEKLREFLSDDRRSQESKLKAYQAMLPLLSEEQIALSLQVKAEMFSSPNFNPSNMRPLTDSEQKTYDAYITASKELPDVTKDAISACNAIKENALSIGDKKTAGLMDLELARISYFSNPLGSIDAENQIKDIISNAGDSDVKAAARKLYGNLLFQEFQKSSSAASLLSNADYQKYTTKEIVESMQNLDGTDPVSLIQVQRVLLAQQRQLYSSEPSYQTRDILSIVGQDELKNYPILQQIQDGLFHPVSEYYYQFSGRSEDLQKQMQQNLDKNDLKMLANKQMDLILGAGIDSEKYFSSSLGGKVGAALRLNGYENLVTLNELSEYMKESDIDLNSYNKETFDNQVGKLFEIISNERGEDVAKEYYKQFNNAMALVGSLDYVASTDAATYLIASKGKGTIAGFDFQGNKEDFSIALAKSRTGNSIEANFMENYVLPAANIGVDMVALGGVGKIMGVGLESIGAGRILPFFTPGQTAALKILGEESPWLLRTGLGMGGDVLAQQSVVFGAYAAGGPFAGGIAEIATAVIPFGESSAGENLGRSYGLLRSSEGEMAPLIRSTAEDISALKSAFEKNGFEEVSQGVLKRESDGSIVRLLENRKEIPDTWIKEGLNEQAARMTATEMKESLIATKSIDARAKDEYIDGLTTDYSNRYNEVTGNNIENIFEKQDTLERLQAASKSGDYNIIGQILKNEVKIPEISISSERQAVLDELATKVKSSLNELDTTGEMDKEIVNMIKETVQDPAERLYLAEKIYGELTDLQKKAILAAHYSEFAPEGIARLLPKADILKAGGLEDDIDSLMRTGITGIEKTGGCFLAGTKIKMADGSYKNIQDIIIGDKVAAFDFFNNKEVDTDVTMTFVRPETKYRIIEYDIIQ